MAAITGVAVVYSVISFTSRSPKLSHISFQKKTSKKNYGLKSASLSVKFGISSLCFGSQPPPPRTGALRVFCSSVEERVKKVIADQLDVKESEIVNNARFVDDLGADSLDTVELIMAFEKEFDIEIPDEEAEKISTVQAALDYIIGKQA